MTRFPFFTKATRYEQLLYRVDSAKYNEIPNQQLQEDLRSFIREDNWLRPYAVMLQANLLLKAGPKIRKNMDQPDFGELRRYAEQNKLYSTAARWILANLIINDTGQETEPFMRLESYEKASRLIDDLPAWTKLNAPVLLQGLISEGPTNIATIDNPRGVPGTRIVPQPFRLQAVYRLIKINVLIDRDISQTLRYVEEAEYICDRALLAYGRNHHYFSTNIMGAQSVLGGIRWLLNSDAQNLGKTAACLEVLIERVEYLKNKAELTCMKAKEWVANARAGLAAILDLNSTEREQYLYLVQEDMRMILRQYGSNAVFLSADPMYRLAHRTLEERLEFEALLEPIRVRKQENHQIMNRTNQFNNSGHVYYFENNTGKVANAVTNQDNSQINFDRLLKELDQMIGALQQENSTEKLNTVQIQELEQLRSEAMKKDGNRLLTGLKACGKYVADVAAKVGVNYISELLKDHLPK